MSQLICKNLTLGYGSGEIIKDLSFEVNAGDYLCIVGANGSGKTTLMRTILGLNAPLSGTIEYSDGLKKAEIGYLPQQTAIQRNFPATVREIVLSGTLSSKPFYTAADKKRAADNMKRMGIADIANKSYRALSGGQQQRVLLARALCATRKMLLLDEPVSGLDPNAADDMYTLINELNSDGITVIMISHDMNVLQNASHTLRIEAQGGSYI